MYDTASPTDRRSAFSDGDLDTASPSKVLVKCFDRLDADLERGLAAIEAHDHEATNRQLGHAQDLLGEMAAMLDTEVWEHAGALLSIYDYVLRLLAAANMRKHAGLVAEARGLLAEIGDGFRAAASSVEQPPFSSSAISPSIPAPVPGSRAPDVDASPDRATSFSLLA